MLFVCSNKKSTSVAKGAKGSQWWKRDVYHLMHHTKTLCGLNIEGWLEFDSDKPDDNLCKRCAAIERLFSINKV